MDQVENAEIPGDCQIDQLLQISQQLSASQQNSDEQVDILQSAFQIVHQQLQSQQNMLMERPDRFEIYELQEIIEGKANIRDFQILIDQLLKQGVIKKNQILSNLVNESQIHSQTHLSRSQLSVDNDALLDDPIRLDQNCGKKPMNTIDHKNSEADKENCFQSPITRQNGQNLAVFWDSKTNDRQGRAIQTQLRDNSSVNDCDLNMDPSALRKALKDDETGCQQAVSGERDGKHDWPVFNSVQQYQIDQINQQLQAFSSDIQQLQMQAQQSNQQKMQQEITNNIQNLPEDLVPQKQLKSKEQTEIDQIKENLKKLMDDMDSVSQTKANKQSVANALHRKANKQDTTKLQAQLNSNFSDVTSKLDKMLSDLSNFFKENKKTIKQFDDSICDLNKKHKQIKSSFEDQNEYIKDRVEKELQGIKNQMNRSGKQYKVDQKQIAICFRNYALEVYGAAILEDNQQNDPLKVILDQIFESKFNALNLNDRFSDMIQKSSKQIEIKLGQSLNGLITDEVEQLEIQLNSLRDQVKNKKKTEDQHFQQKVDWQITTQNLKELEADVKSKANIMDVCALLDSKASTSTVFELMDEMKKSIVLLSAKIDSQNASQNHVDSFLRRQNTINQQLCPLNQVAQFQWFGHLSQPKKFSQPFQSAQDFESDKQQHNKLTSFTLSSTRISIRKLYQVLWDQTNINCVPSAVVLSKDQQPSILLKEPGIYHLSFVFALKQTSPVDIELRIDELHVSQQKQQFNSVVKVDAFINTQKSDSKVQVYLLQKKHQQLSREGSGQEADSVRWNQNKFQRSNSESKQSSHMSNSVSYCDKQTMNSSIFSAEMVNRKQSINERIVEQANETKRQLAGNFASRENDKQFNYFLDSLQPDMNQVIAKAIIKKL